MYLINGKKVTLKVKPSDRTDEVLEVRHDISRQTNMFSVGLIAVVFHILLCE